MKVGALDLTAGETAQKWRIGMTAVEFRAIRKATGLTQALLAKSMGISRRSVAGYEAGDYPIPRLVEVFMQSLQPAA